MKNPSQILTSSLPLDVIFQQCHDDDHMSPVSNEQAWLDCLQDVYVGQSYQPLLIDLANAINKVWQSELPMKTFSDGLSYFKNASGAKAFDQNAITFQIERFYGSDCLILSGDTAYVACGNNASLRFDGNASYSLLIWMKFNSQSTGWDLMGRMVGDSWDTEQPTVGGYIFLASVSSTRGVESYLRSYRYAAPYQCDAYCNITAGQKYFFGTTFDGAVSKVYQDGVLKGSETYTAPLGNAPDYAQFMIGCCYRGYQWSLDSCVQGSIARAAVFNRALSDAEIQNLNSTILTGKEANLVAYWDFTTQSAADLSGNGNNGTLMGSATFGSGY